MKHNVFLRFINYITCNIYHVVFTIHRSKNIKLMSRDMNPQQVKMKLYYYNQLLNLIPVYFIIQELKTLTLFICIY